MTELAGRAGSPAAFHRWNTSFTWQDHTGSFSLLDRAQARQFDEQGFIVLEGMFNRSELASVEEELDAHEALVDGSSLTPHLTGPNVTDDVRKAYILQYAPSGAFAPDGDPAESTTSRVPQDDPAYQFPVLRAGAPA